MDHRPSTLAAVASGLALLLTGSPAAADDPGGLPIESLTPAHKAAFLGAAAGPEKGREKARAQVAAWGALSKQAAQDLRKLVAGKWPFPAKPGGWKGKQAPAGGLREIDVPGLGMREYYLAVPAGYKPDRNWPLAVSLHGAGGNGPDDYGWCWAKWAKQWPGFVACPSGVPAGAQWFPEQRAFVAAMLADARRHFAIDDDRVALHGFSNGGNGAWYYGCHFPSLWCGVITRGGGCPVPNLLPNLTGLPCAIVHGDKDEVIPVSHDREAAATLKELGCAVLYKEIPGGGHDPFLDKLNGELLPWLGKQRRKPWPAMVSFLNGSEKDARAHWVEVPRQEADWREFSVEVKEGNRIEVSGSRVQEMVLWLSDELLDLDKPVTVADGEEILFQGVVSRSAGDLLRWLDETGDRAAAPVARLVIKR